MDGIMAPEDPYKALGLGRDASPQDIRRAYRKLAKKHHPDMNPGDARSEARFKEISAANGLLSDPARKAGFDRGEIDADGQAQSPRSGYREQAESEAGRRYGPGGGWGDEGFEDLFGSLFRRQTSPGPRRGQNERFILTTSFLNAVNGATQRLTLPDDRSLDVKVPPGTAEGQVLRLKGRGTPGSDGGLDGDALIEIHIAPHPYFTRDGQDLRMTLPISLQEAVIGGLVETPTPSGLVKLRIPAHADSGVELRLRGRGVPANGERSIGDLYVTLRIEIGPPDTALDDFIRGWTPASAPNPRATMETGP